MTRLRSPVPVVGMTVALALVVVSIMFGRADVAIVAMTLLVAVGVSLRAPRGESPSTTRITVTGGGSGRGARMQARIELQTAEDTDLAAVRILVLNTELRRVSIAGGAGTILVDIPVVHSGDQEVVSVQHREASADAARLTGPSDPVTERIVVEPQAETGRFLPLPHRLRGLTGGHDSSRPGDGGEFRDIHPFATGDRLRRIDWKATARLARSPSDLFVRRTDATSDAHVAIVLDDDADVGEQVETWPTGDPMHSGTTSMDVARDAAWSLASAYLDAGDTVSFQVLSRARGTVRHGAGARHRELLRATIARASARPRGFTRARTPLVAPGALIVVLSAFLDDDALHLVELWRAAGHRVIAVDTLPSPHTAGLSREKAVALRVVLARRADRLHDLVSVGADPLHWDVPEAERAATLRALTRIRRGR